MPVPYLVKRLGLTMLTVISATFLCFVMLRLAPGDPAELILQKVFVGPEDYMADEDAKQTIVSRFELDSPLYRQYGAWLTAALGGDLGYSFRTGQRIRDDIGLRFLADGFPEPSGHGAFAYSHRGLRRRCRTDEEPLDQKTD